MGAAPDLTQPEPSNRDLARRQRLCLIGGMAAVALGSAAFVTGTDDGFRLPEKPRPEDSPLVTDLTLLPERSRRESWVRDAEERMTGIERRIDALSKSLSHRAAQTAESEERRRRTEEALARELAALKEELAKHGRDSEALLKKARDGEDEETADSDARSDPAHPNPARWLRGNGPWGSGSSSSSRLNDSSPMNPAYDPRAAGTYGAGGLGYVSAGAGAASDVPRAGASAEAGRSASGLAKLEMPSPEDERRLTPPEPAKTVTRPDAPLVRNRAAGTTVETYIPPGSFAAATLLTGCYAATGSSAGNQPVPVVMKVEAAALMPNRWKSDLTECHATGAATGDLSSERIQIRLDRLACVGPKGETLDVAATGYVVGTDGKVGLRGRLVTKSGQAIANALQYSILSGVGRAVSLSAESTETSITGTQTTTYGNAWKAGLGRGLSNGMERLVDYYLSIADRIFPVLEAEAGQRVDIVFGQGVLLGS